MLGLNLEAKTIIGYIIDKGDTTQVTMMIPLDFSDEVSLKKVYTKIKIKNDEKPKYILKPRKGLEVLFFINGSKYHLKSMEHYHGYSTPLFSSDNNDYGFMRVLFDGKYIKVLKALKVDTYNHYTNNQHTSTTVKKIVDVILISGQSYKKINWINFKNEMINYFNACPELCEKIKTKEFTKKELVKIARFYEYNCK